MVNVVVWGAGKNCRTVIDSLRTDKCMVTGIIDSDRKLQGHLFEGVIRIFSLEELCIETTDYIVISVQNSTDILRQCEMMGVDEKKVIDYWKNDKKYDFIDANVKRIYELEKELVKFKLYLKNIPYELGVKPAPVILPAEDLLEKILKEKKSLSRFGDGEIEIMRRRERPWFQTVDEKLSCRLEEVFYCTDERIVIALADDFGSLEKYTENAACTIREYLDNGVREEVMKIIDMGRIYYDAYVTRPYLIYRDKHRAKHIFDLFKCIWKDRDILLVEGERSYSGVRNDLFSCAKSVRRIIAPAQNAFSVYESIYTLAKEYAMKDTLVLISLGPTATVLSYDLATEGIQALDMGQLDNEYEWYLRGADTRIPIPGKCVAELSQCHMIPPIQDEEYDKQVICKIDGKQ